MRNTFFDRRIPSALRFALVGGLVGLMSVACSQSAAPPADDTSGAGGAGTGGDAQPAAGDANPGTGGQSSGSAGMGTAGAGGASVGGAAGSGSPIVDAGPRTAPLKIMALGDSTTEFSCFRAELAKLLDKSHPKDYQYVGTRVNDFGGCGGYVYDKHNQGMSSYLVSSTSGAMNTHAEAPTWAALKPDVVLLHFATNDVWNLFPPTKILTAYTYIVGEFRKANPRVTFIAAQVIPVDPIGGDGGMVHSCTGCPDATKALNAAMPAWVAATNTAASRVVIVDQWTGYDAVVDSCTPGRCDGVHPGPTGSVKMGAKWAEALEQFF